MIRNKFLVSCIAVIIILMAGCTKESTETGKGKSTLSENDLKVGNTIKTFIAKVAYHNENPAYKSGETVSSDSALWLLEATINYAHAFPNEFYSEFEIDSLSITVARNADGTIDMNELTGKYDEMKQAVADVYHNSGYEEKGLAVVDLEVCGETEDEITFSIQTCVGEKGTPPPDPGVNGPFVEEDDWWYGEEYGFCYDHTVFGDASIMLYDEAVNLVPDPNGNYGFINLYMFSVEGGDPYFQRDLTPDNYLDYWLYYSIEGSEIPFIEDDMLCVEWQEMNAYYAYLKGLMFDILPNHYLPEVLNKFGYSIESFNNLDWKKYDDNPPYTSYLHKATFTYGIKINYGEGEGPEEL